MDERIRKALQQKSLVRVIICVRKKPSDRTVIKRGLDPEVWAVTVYNDKTGDCTLKRGVRAKNRSMSKIESAVDDLSDVPKGSHCPDRAKVVAHVIKRDNRIRKYVLKRARGKCEYCGDRGFLTANGGF